MNRFDRLRSALVVLLVPILLAACTSPPRVGGVLEPVATLKIEPRDAVQRVVVSPDGKYVAAKGHDRKTIYVWDVARRELIYRLPHATAPESRVAFTPDGKYLYTGDRFPYQDQLIRDAKGRSSGADGKERVRELKAEERFSAHLWNLQTGEKLRTFYFDREQNVCWYTGTQFRADGKQFAEGNNRGIYLCDADTAKPIRFIAYPWMNEQGKPREERGTEPYLSYPKAFTVLQDWKTAVVAANRHYPDKSVEMALLWLDLASGEIIRQVAATPKLHVSFFDATALIVNADALLIVPAITTYYDPYRADEEVKDFIARRPLSVFNGKNAERVAELSVAHAQRSVALSSDGQLLFVAGDRLTVWELSSSRKIGEFRHDNRHTIYLDLSSDGRTLVGGMGDTIYVWSVKTNEQRFARQ